jgi:hypothetical protein
VERPNPFRWLTQATNGSTLPVLVPVLIGAGAVLSAIAYVVERIAEATALPAFDRQVAQRLATMSPPPAGLLSGPVDSRVTSRHGGGTGSRGGRRQAGVAPGHRPPRRAPADRLPRRRPPGPRASRRHPDRERRVLTDERGPYGVRSRWCSRQVSWYWHPGQPAGFILWT